MSALVTFGEGLGVLRAPTVGSLAQLPTLDVSTGGAEVNVAIGARRLGTETRWLGRVGDDGMGRRVVRELRAEGVNVDVIVDARPTGVLIKETPVSGQTVITNLRTDSAGSHLDATDIDRLRLEPGDVLHLTGITPALSASARAATLFAIERARAVGVAISYDVNHRSKLWSSAEAAPVHRAIAERADVLFAGEDELRMVLGIEHASIDELVGRAREIGPAEVLIKRGALGASALIDGTLFTQPAMPVAVVDSVGAGDAFVAGYLSARLAGAAAEERLDLAAYCGARACQHPGDWEGAARTGDRAHDDSDPVRR